MLEDTKTKKINKRLKIIEGQVRGLQDMITEKKYCIDIITQISAVKRALSAIEDELMQSHISTCAINQIRNKDEKRAVAEILKVYKLKK